MTNDIQTHYRKLVKEHGDSYLSGQYTSEETQELRFDQLLRAGDIQDKKILDFGCGTAALAGYIQKQGIKCEYVGYDFVEEFYEITRKKYPDARFIDENTLYNEKFDYIFISGVFNNKTENNVEFYQSTLKKLFLQTNGCLSFNMMSSYVDYQDEGLFYIKPEEVFTFCKTNITPYVIIVNDYQLKAGVIPFEFACFLYNK